jgi:hypothetical protein
MVSQEQSNLRNIVPFQQKSDKNYKLGSCGAKIVKIRNSKLALPDKNVGMIFVLLSREGLLFFTVSDIYS